MSEVETPDFVRFARRVIAAAGERVAARDPSELADIAALHGAVDDALEAAVAGLRDEPHPYSWADIARPLGITRQAAMQRWPNVGGARHAGGQPVDLR